MLVKESEQRVTRYSQMPSNATDGGFMTCHVGLEPKMPVNAPPSVQFYGAATPTPRRDLRERPRFFRGWIEAIAFGLRAQHSDRRCSADIHTRRPRLCRDDTITRMKPHAKSMRTIAATRAFRLTSSACVSSGCESRRQHTRSRPHPHLEAKTSNATRYDYFDDLT